MGSTIIVYSTLILIFTVISAFLSGVETTLVSANKLKIENLARSGSNKAKRAKKILDRTDSAIGMVLIGNNIANITATALITFVLTKAFLINESELLIYTGLQAMIFLLFCEIVPKLISKANPESVLMNLSIPVYYLMIFFKPLICISLKVSDLLKSKLGVGGEEKSLISSKDDIATYFSIGKKEGVIDEERQHYISEILEFKNNMAFEIMTPMVDLVALDIDSSVKQLVDLIEKTKFSRIPVYEKSKENILGYVHYKYLLQSKTNISLRDLLIPATYIPTTKNVFELYGEMHLNRTPFLFVVNEYGNVVGILTFEDIAEEIVGEIETDDHPDDNLISKITERKYELSGRLDIDYFKRFFSVKLEKKNFETMGGFITYLHGNIPGEGERIKYQDMEFLVTSRGKLTVDRVELQLSKRQIKKKIT